MKCYNILNYRPQKWGLFLFLYSLIGRRSRHCDTNSTNQSNSTPMYQLRVALIAIVGIVSAFWRELKLHKNKNEQAAIENESPFITDLD